MISKRNASYMYVAFLLVVLMTTSSAVQKIAELEVIEGNDGANCNKTVKLLLHPDVLQGDAYRDTPCHVVSVCGKQGVMKSTLLRALSIFFGMEKGDFHTSNSDGATTTSVDISDVSRDNHLFLDTIGNEDPSFAMHYDLDSRAIDRAFSQLVAPAANVLIYPINRKIYRGDLENLAMYADHTKYHVGEMQKQPGTKPTLIIAILTNALSCTVNRKPKECSSEQYLLQSIPKSNPIWSTFGRIELVRIPNLQGADWEKIQPADFRPQDVPQYWQAIQGIGKIINENKQTDLSSYWSGGQLGRMFVLMLPMINDDIGVDPPFVHRILLITSKAQDDARKLAEPLDQLMQPYVDEPYRESEHYENLLPMARKDAEAEVLVKYQVHKDEGKLYAAIQHTVADEFNKKEADIRKKVYTRKQAIDNHLDSVYESAQNSLTVSEKSLFNALTGGGSEVDIALVGLMRRTIEQYDAALATWIPPELKAKGNRAKLIDRAVSIWHLAHEINNAKHNSHVNDLRAKTLPPIEFDYLNSHDEPSFKHTDVYENLATKYPKFFSDAALNNTVSIKAMLDATPRKCTGALTLHGNNKEYRICGERDHANKWFASEVLFNPVSKVLHAYTEGGGFRGGRYTNRNRMGGVKFTVTHNALSTAPEQFRLPYSRGAAPDFPVKEVDS